MRKNKRSYISFEVRIVSERISREKDNNKVITVVYLYDNHNGRKVRIFERYDAYKDNGDMRYDDMYIVTRPVGNYDYLYENMIAPIRTVIRHKIVDCSKKAFKKGKAEYSAKISYEF